MVFREMLMSNIVYIVTTELCLFIALLILNLKENKNTVKKFFKSIRNGKIILTFMLLFILFVFIIQILYMCTYYTQNKILTLAVAKGFTEGKTNLFYNDGSSVKNQNSIRDPYSYGSFYPFILSVLFFLFGVNTYYIYVLDALAGALLTLFIFLVIYILTSDKRISIYGMVISGVSLVYYAVEISGNNPQFQFFLFLYSMCLFLMFFSFKKNTFLSYSLFFIGSLFLIDTRPEGVVISFAFAAGLLLYKKNDMKNVNFWLRKILPALVLFFIFFPIPTFHYAAHYFNNMTDSFVDAFSSLLKIFYSQLPVIAININNNIGIFISDFIFFWTQFLFLPMLFTILFAFAGIAFTLKNKKSITIILLILFFLHNLLYLLWNNGYQTRYAILTIIPYMVFASLGFIPVQNFMLRYKDRFKSLVLYFPNYEFRFKPLLFIIPVYLLVVSGFFTVYIIENRSICEANPLDISEFESALQPLIENISYSDANILVVGDEILSSKAEFILLRSTYVVNHYIYYKFLITEPLSNSTYGTKIMGGGFESKPELLKERERLLNLCFKVSVDDILQNEEKQAKFKHDIIRENTYLLTECKYMDMKEAEYTMELMNELLDMELLYEKNCVYVYKVKEKSAETG